MNRRQRDGSMIEVPSAPVVKSYNNNNMGGVDLNDQLRRYYMTGRKSKNWWCCLLCFLVNLCIVNAHIWEKLLRHHRNRTHLAFCLDLVKNLIGDFSARKFSASSVQIEGRHCSIPYSKGHCKCCLKQRKVT